MQSITSPPIAYALQRHETSRGFKANALLENTFGRQMYRLCPSSCDKACRTESLFVYYQSGALAGQRMQPKGIEQRTSGSDGRSLASWRRHWALASGLARSLSLGEFGVAGKDEAFASLPQRATTSLCKLLTRLGVEAAQELQEARLLQLFRLECKSVLDEVLTTTVSAIA